MDRCVQEAPSSTERRRSLPRVAQSPLTPNPPPSSIASGGEDDAVGDSAGTGEIAGEGARELDGNEAVGAIGGESEGAVGPR